MKLDDYNEDGCTPTATGYCAAQSPLKWSDTWRVTSPVDAKPAGATADGIMGMAGNVSEWTSSNLAAHAVVRGGSWLDGEPADFEVAVRHLAKPGFRSPIVGFRCAKRLDPAE